MNNTIKTVLGILLSIGLCILIFFEFRAGFYNIRNNLFTTTEWSISQAKDSGKASVSIDEIITYDEVPPADVTGDVILLDKFNIKLKINGALTDDSMKDYGKYTYSALGSNSPTTLNVEHRTVGVEDFEKAVREYWNGNSNDILTACNISAELGSVMFYQSSSKEGVVPVVYLSSTGMYYMFIECEDSGFIIVSSSEPFNLTDDKVTIHFSNPSENPMYAHTYSDYEALAAENTIRELLESDKDDKDDLESPYESQGVLGSSETYTSKADDETRKKLAALANFQFKPDGTSDETLYTIDITSEEAKKSQWALESTEYIYESKGLKLSMLSGTRSKDIFSISGNINNTLDASRPYVLVIKYLDSNGNLLGISVIDKREKPIGGLDASAFNATINPTQNNINIQKIASVMFEVH